MIFLIAKATFVLGGLLTMAGLMDEAQRKWERR
jgi:hypothetical protein